MMLDVPYFKNPTDRHCWPACIRMALKYFFPEREFSWEEVNEIVEMPPAPCWSWPTAALVNLRKLGLKTEYYGAKSYFDNLAKKGKDWMFEYHSPRVAEDILTHSENFETIVNAVKRGLEQGIFIDKKLSMDELRQLVAQGKIAICSLNWNVINNKKGFEGHVVLVTGFDDSNIYVHNPTAPGVAPEPNRKINNELFAKAWSADGAGKDCYVIYK